MFISRSTGMVLCDPTKGETTATTNTGTKLAVAEACVEDDSQLWTIMPQGTSGLYNLINKHTQHTANLSGGKTDDGSDIVSYNTDSRNSTSTNRLWKFVRKDAMEIEPEDPDSPEEPDNPDVPDTPDIPDAIASAPLADYALGYTPATKVLHFGAEHPEQLTFRVSIYSSRGECVRTFRASDECSVSDLPKGVYIILWREEDRTCSVKLAL